MMLRLYADESGMHHYAEARVLFVGGCIASIDDWERFEGRWQAILDKYGVPYFHFQDYNSRNRHPEDKTNPYHHLQGEDLENMLYDLAIETGLSVVPFGGMYNLVKHHELAVSADPFREVWKAFWKSFYETMEDFWKGFKNDVECVFDQHTDAQWILALNAEFWEAAKKDPRIKKWAFDDDKRNYGLQAADLHSYLAQQKSVPYMENGHESQPLRLLDMALHRRTSFKNLDVPDALWRIGVRGLLQDMRKQRAVFRASGNTGPWRYHPQLDNPQLKALEEEFHRKFDPT